MTPGCAFSAVVGQDEAKLALLLAAVRAAARAACCCAATRARPRRRWPVGLAGAAARRGALRRAARSGPPRSGCIGSLDLAELLTNGQPRFRPGLLAAAHGGVLYVDEINLLADHLVDALLDVAVSGVNRVERDGLSHTHAARFVLVGSMNPEEGELRPQLLDRFGLAVDVRAAATAGERREVVRRQLAAEATSRGLGRPGRATRPTTHGSGTGCCGPATRRSSLPDEVVDVATPARARGGRRGPAGRPHALPGGAGARRPRRPRRGRASTTSAAVRRHGARSPPAPPPVRRARASRRASWSRPGMSATSPDAGGR